MNPYFFLKQVVGDYWNCDLEEQTMNSSQFFLATIEKAIKIVKTRIIKYTDHKFEPQGYTLLMILADSSLILHSWPEEKFISVEIFTCTKYSDPEAGLRNLAKSFKAEKFDLKRIK